MGSECLTALVHPFDMLRGMARVAWWWNGKWGKLARRDVEIHHQPETWTVIARMGGPEGKPWIKPVTDEAEAKQVLARLTSTDEAWRSMN